jgi:CHAD domain-containing protein
MVRELDPTRSPSREVRRVIRGRLRDSVDRLDRVTPDDVAAAVHDTRRNCKEVRALLRLVDSTATGQARELDRVVRDAARALAPARDAHVAAEIAAPLDAPAPPAETEAPAPAVSPDVCREAMARASERLHEAIRLSGRISTDRDVNALRHGLHHTYRRSHEAFDRARRRPTELRMHAWRTWNKRLWYQVRFLSVTAPSVLVPFAELLELVGDALGDVHDLDVFLAGDRAEALSEAQRQELIAKRETEATRAAEFAGRLVELWKIAAEQGPEPDR